MCLSINTHCLLETKTISIITLLVIWISKDCYFSWANPSTNLNPRVRAARARFQPVPEPFLVPRVRLSHTQLVPPTLKVRSIGVYSVHTLVPLPRVKVTKTQEVRWWCSVAKTSDDLMYQNCYVQAGVPGVYIWVRQEAGHACSKGKLQRRVAGVFSSHRWKLRSMSIGT